MASILELELRYCITFINSNPYISYITDPNLLSQANEALEQHTELQHIHDTLFRIAKRWSDLYRLYIFYLKLVGLEIFIPLTKTIPKDIYWSHQELVIQLLELCIRFHQAEIDCATAIFSMETILIPYLDPKDIDHPMIIDYFRFRGLMHEVGIKDASGE
jgi:hypothetical protein